MSYTAETASDKYIELEKEFNELTGKIFATPDYRRQKDYRRKKKLIRAEQNQLFKYMQGTSWVHYTEDMLGLKGNQVLYKRTVRRKKA